MFKIERTVSVVEKYEIDEDDLVEALALIQSGTVQPMDTDSLLPTVTALSDLYMRDAEGNTYSTAKTPFLWKFADRRDWNKREEIGLCSTIYRKINERVQAILEEQGII